MTQWQPQRSQQVPPGSQQRPVQGPSSGWRPPQSQGPPPGWVQRPVQAPVSQQVPLKVPVQPVVEPKGKKLMLRVLLTLIAITTVAFVMSVIYFYLVYIRG